MGIVGKFNKWIESLLYGGVGKEEYARRQTRERAEELYQVKEHGNKLWLTYDNHLVCPVEMFENKDAIAVLGILRDLYFKDVHGSTEKEDTK